MKKREKEGKVRGDVNNKKESVSPSYHFIVCMNSRSGTNKTKQVVRRSSDRRDLKMFEY